MSLIAVFTAVIISLSAHSGRVFEAAEGYNAPMISLSRGDSVSVSLADMKGHHVLLNFWSSLEPESRIANKAYDVYASDSRLSLISVNLDPSARLFREIVARDALCDSTQWHVGGDVARQISDDYNLARGLGSFLIDPAGRVVAINPSRAQIESLLAS